ncbi:MAG: polyprenyl synthetase family protein [Clostridiaceae bacterium]
MLSSQLSAYAALTDKKLGELLSDDSIPEILRESMAYSVFSGGKRLRPSLCMAACELCGGAAEDALLPACAVELIHTYSLIHDDLPAMDNDDMRRGKPSSHIAFGEANAILAGDGLQALAFDLLSDCPARDALKHISRGAFEMVMGQSLDCNTEGKAELLNTLQDYKTGALFRAAVGAGAACARAGASEQEALSAFAGAYGMLFQITDDILDFEGNPDTLGKSVGKDASAGKVTFVSVYGPDGAKTYAKTFAREAKKAVLAIGRDASFFTELIDYTLTRQA